MFRRKPNAATLTPPSAPALIHAQPSGPIAPAVPPFIDDVGDYTACLCREARARHDHIKTIPRSELPDGPARWELLRRAMAGQLYDAYEYGGEWHLIVPPPTDRRICYPRTSPALWELHISTGQPLVYD